jgi:cysteinyl-tRNA synthetase
MYLTVQNQRTRQREPFEPREGNIVRMYVCGSTVYDEAHIGHAMSALVFDVIRRYLQHMGYRVVHVMNFTDVDDKVIERAQGQGVAPLDLAQHYIDEWFDHVRALNLLPAHHYPRVSEVIPQIVTIIEGLRAKGYAYPADGDVYFRVRRFEDYGRLSGRSVDAALAGSQESLGSGKEDPLDFALWKAAKPGEPQWESPWGPGRPGWHIECTAMAIHYLGPQIDIHGGGNDLLFPHHENEIAQSEAYTGQRPFARYWLHNGMLQLRGAKMSKSLGNLITIRAFLAEHPADVLRLAVLSSHYRKPLAYDSALVADARRAWHRLRGALRPPTGGLDGGDAVDVLRAALASARGSFHNAMRDDFNTAGALGQLFTLTRAINVARDTGVGGEPFAEAQAGFRQLAHLLGLELPEDTGRAEVADLVEALVHVRTVLRREKAWALADEVRDRLVALGVVIEDGAQGTDWRWA